MIDINFGRFCACHNLAKTLPIMANGRLIVSNNQCDETRTAAESSNLSLIHIYQEQDRETEHQPQSSKQNIKQTNHERTFSNLL